MAIRRGLSIILVVLSLAGCTPAAPDSGALPSGISLEVHQTRPDIGIRQLEIGVHNDTEADLTVNRLEFDSTQFVEPVTWKKGPTTIGSGVSADLPVLLPEAACDDRSPTTTVTLDYELSDGRSGTASATPADDLERMPRIEDEDCFAKSISDIATIDILNPPRMVDLGGSTTAQLDLTITPSGAGGSFTIESSLSTPLISMADATTGETTAEGTVGRIINGSDGPGVVTLTIRPGRCDTHAIAEDKRGTIFGLRVLNPEGVEGVIFVTSPDNIKIALFEFVQTVCGG